MDRVPIPRDTAALVLFEHDRTCCVCRARGKPVQIHHVDDDPGNNLPRNLAVLCFDCHRDTQITGGFDRKLDAEQVTLYRDDWCRLVGRQRALLETRPTDDAESKQAAALAEIYRADENYLHLAIHFSVRGDVGLRDKYIELALVKECDDQTVVFLRGLQERPDLIPPEVVDREFKRYTRERDWLQRARFHLALGRSREAVADYARGIYETLNHGRVFSAAFYLKELSTKSLDVPLFIQALKDAREEGDLWWQVRSLQELGWEAEVRALVLKNAVEIDKSRDPHLGILLAEARGDRDRALELEKELARRAWVAGGKLVLPGAWAA